MSRRPLLVAALLLPSTAVGCATAPVDDDDDGTAHPLARCVDIATSYQRITRIDLPTTIATSRALGFDLDQDGTPDNALADGYISFRALAGNFDPGPRMNARLSANEVSWWLRVDQCDDVGSDPEIASVRLESWDLGTDAMVPLGRAFANGRVTPIGVTATGGSTALPLGLFADPTGALAEPAWTAATALHLDLVRDAADPTTFRGRVGVALANADMRAALVVPLRAFINADPSAAEFRAALDADHDGDVSAAELTSSVGFDLLLAADLDGADGERAASSFAFGIETTTD